MMKYLPACLLIKFDKGIRFKASDAQYNNLKALCFAPDCNDEVSSTGESLQLIYRDKLSILRDYREGAMTPFVGLIQGVVIRWSGVRRV